MFVPTVRLLHYSLYQKDKIAPLHGIGRSVRRCRGWKGESPFLQHLTVYHHAAGFPVKEFDAVTVYEDEHVTPHEGSRPSYLSLYRTGYENFSSCPSDG